jgi:hypothetical protein
MQEEKMIKSCFSLRESQHKTVRRHCVDVDRTVQDVFAEAMTQWIEVNIDGSFARVPAKGARK